MRQNNKKCSVCNRKGVFYIGYHTKYGKRGESDAKMQSRFYESGGLFRGGIFCRTFYKISSAFHCFDASFSCFGSNLQTYFSLTEVRFYEDSCGEQSEISRAASSDDFQNRQRRLKIPVLILSTGIFTDFL